MSVEQVPSPEHYSRWLEWRFRYNRTDQLRRVEADMKKDLARKPAGAENEQLTFITDELKRRGSESNGSSEVL